jgi:hypothetical protein
VELAAWTQALYVRMMAITLATFQRTWMSVCKDMMSTASLLRTAVLAEPTGAVRTLLNDSLLYARAGNGFLEVWSCFPVEVAMMNVLKQDGSCTVEIPINFTLADGSVHFGYLDPRSLVISRYGQPADCFLNPSLPVQLDGKLHMYRRSDGLLVDIGNATELSVLNYRTDGMYTAFFKPVIYTPLVSYTWNDIMPGVITNSLLKSTAAQAEVLELLTAPLYSTDDSDGEVDGLAENLVARGLKTIKGFLLSPFHVWVFLACLVTNLWLVGQGVLRCLPLHRPRELVNRLRCRLQRTHGSRSPDDPDRRRMALQQLRAALGEFEAITDDGAHHETVPLGGEEADVSRCDTDEPGLVSGTQT